MQIDSQIDAQWPLGKKRIGILLWLLVFQKIGTLPQKKTENIGSMFVFGLLGMSRNPLRSLRPKVAADQDELSDCHELRSSEQDMGGEEKDTHPRVAEIQIN